MIQSRFGGYDLSQHFSAGTPALTGKRSKPPAPVKRFALPGLPDLAATVASKIAGPR